MNHMKEALKRKRMGGFDITISIGDPHKEPDGDEGLMMDPDLMAEEDDVDSDEQNAELAPEVKDKEEEPVELEEVEDPELDSPMNQDPKAMQKDASISDDDKLAKIEAMTGSLGTGGSLRSKVGRHWMNKFGLKS